MEPRNKPLHIWSNNFLPLCEDHSMTKGVFNKWCWISWVSTCKGMTLDSYLTSNTKTISKWTKDFNIKAKTIRKKNIRKKASWCWIWQWFLDYDAKSTLTEAKEDNIDYIKILKFFVSKDTVNSAKRQHIEWDKIFADHISDKGLISRIYEGLDESNNNHF